MATKKGKAAAANDTDLPPELGDGTLVEGKSPPPGKGPQMALTRTEAEGVAIRGEVEIGWAKSPKDKTKAKVNLKVRCAVDSADLARVADDLVPGSLGVYERGRAHEDDEEHVPVNSHAQRSGMDELHDWTLEFAEPGDVAALYGALEAQAPIRSLTCTASQGTVTFTVGVTLEVAVGDLPKLVAFDGQPVRLTGASLQASLPFAANE